MPHKKEFDSNEETIHQTSLAEKIQKQTDLTANEPQRKHLKVMLIGCPELVRSAIHYSHVTGQAEVGDRSPLQPCPHDPEEMMSILVRKVTVK